MIDLVGSATSAAAGGAAQVASAAPLGGAQPTPAASVAQATGFGAALAEAATNAAGVLKAGEAAAISGIRGQTSVQQVVEAVMAAEQTLNTAIAVRDKVVSAYLEISRMQI